MSLNSRGGTNQPVLVHVRFARQSKEEVLLTILVRLYIGWTPNYILDAADQLHAVQSSHRTGLRYFTSARAGVMES